MDFDMAKVAVLGFGVVGSGVAGVLASNNEKIAEKAREPIELKYILDTRDFPGSPFASLVIKDFETIETDDEVSVVVECIGGCGSAYEFVSRCLKAGKSVVTSNKELIATRGLELLNLAKGKKVSLLFEASVGGGIPIIRPLAQCLASNAIEEIYGILNGTTNYILTQMVQCGKDFDESLSEAQRLGYAEADPAADILGTDACRKICILADMCFGHNVSPEKVKTTGITQVTASDVTLAGKLGYSIKLLGRALRVNGGDEISAYVSPHLVKDDSMLASVSGVMNGIVVKGNAVGECLFYGPGAGQMPTASAVVADVIDAVLHIEDKKYIDWGPEKPELFIDSDEVVSQFFIKSEGTLNEEACFGEIVTDGSYSGCLTKPMTMTELLSKKLPLVSAFRVLQ